MVLDGGPLVVEHRGARDAQRGRGDGDIVGAVAERDVEAPIGALLGVRPAEQRAGARGEPAGLRGEALAAVAADRGVGDLQALQQPERLGEVASGDVHLVAVLAQQLDDGAHDEHVGAVGEVDPDAHRADDIFGRCWSSPRSPNRSSRSRWHFVRDAGLPAVFVLMAVGSACIPMPSEVVMLFAGFAVADPGGSGAHHHLTMTGVVLAGLLGTLVGSWIAYGVGRGGRLELLERHGHLLHMGPAQIERADRWFQRYGDPTVLFGRMVPLVRAFVSLPAGVARMPLWRFTVLTLIGSIPWVLALGARGRTRSAGTGRACARASSTSTTRSSR